MRALYVYNTHRGFGGADRATECTIEVLRAGGVEVRELVRDSRDLPPTFAGRARAFLGGLYSADAVREFSHRLRHERPDVVHVFELYPLISPWILPLCAEAGVAVVMTCYDYRLTCPIATHFHAGEECFQCLGGREYRCVLRNCRNSVPESLAYALRNASARRFRLFDRNVHRFVAISTHQREFLIRHLGLEPSRVVINPCSIALPESAVADPSLGTYVGYAGRFVPEKGIEVMVAACRLAHLPMAFAGDAPGHPAVQTSDAASFVMTRSREDLEHFYRGARMIVVPSLWAETFGLVPGEAMSHGVPVVASRIGGLQGTVLDGVTGLLAQPGNAADLAAKLRQIWDDPELARRLGRAARDRVATQFSPRAHFDQMLAIYAQAIALAGAGGR